jgi:hypothetical protein
MIYFGPDPYTGNGFYFGDPFDLLNTVPTENDLITLIYLMLGITPSDIPEEIVQLFLDQYLLLYPDNECLVLYHTTISVYNWLIRKSGADAVSGSRREKKGRREIEIRDSNKSSDWKGALDNFLRSPWETYPQCRATFASGIGPRIIIGGVSKTESDRVKSNSDSLSQNDERSPYTPSTPDDGGLY